MGLCVVDKIPSRQKSASRTWAERMIKEFRAQNAECAKVELDAEIEVNNTSYALLALRNVVEREGIKDEIKVMQRRGEIYLEKKGVEDE